MNYQQWQILQFSQSQSFASLTLEAIYPKDTRATRKKGSTLSPHLRIYNDIVKPEWIDYNEHMTEAYYVLTFGFATEEFQNHVGGRRSISCSYWLFTLHS